MAIAEALACVLRFQCRQRVVRPEKAKPPGEPTAPRGVDMSAIVPPAEDVPDLTFKALLDAAVPTVALERVAFLLRFVESPVGSEPPLSRLAGRAMRAIVGHGDEACL